MINLVLKLNDFINSSPTYSYEFAWFYNSFLMIWHMRKHVSYTLKILNLIILYYHSMPWFVCWVLSDFIGQEWLKGWKRNIQKWKESTKWSFWRNWQRCERVTPETQMTQTRDWRGRVEEQNSRWRDRVTHADAWRARSTEIAEVSPSNCWTLFDLDPNPENTD